MVGRPAPPSPSMHNGINAENTAEHLDTAHRKQAAGPLTMQASLAQMSPCIETDTRTGTHNCRWERPEVATRICTHNPEREGFGCRPGAVTWLLLA